MCAFLLLPLQVSVLGFTSLSVSSTNLLYNVVGTPGGVLRYFREKRMAWPLAASIIAGTVPGVLIGYYLRFWLLPEPRTFKFFVGLRLLKDFATTPKRPVRIGAGAFHTCDTTVSFNKIGCTFLEKHYRFSLFSIFIPAIGVGIVGGMYGIGGGAIIAPFLITFIHLPIYAVADAELAANSMTSVAGVIFYSTFSLHQGVAVPPDWFLGILFGLGGMLGMYCGARWQHRAPERGIKAMLAIVVFAVSSFYILKYLSDKL